MTEINTDKRHFHRIFYNAEATLSNGADILNCSVIDISLKGCLLRFEEAWKGSQDKLYIINLPLSDDIDITMQVSVSHVVGNNAGFKCEHIDIDSISQLRRLVELNLGNSDFLERDLLALNDYE